MLRMLCACCDESKKASKQYESNASTNILQSAMEDVNRRLRSIALHLDATGEDGSPIIVSSPCSSLNPNELANFLVRDNHELRQRIYAFLQDDLFAPKPYMSLMEFRELTLKRLQAVVSQKFFSVFDYTRGSARSIYGTL